MRYIIYILAILLVFIAVPVSADSGAGVSINLTTEVVPVTPPGGGGGGWWPSVVDKGIVNWSDIYSNLITKDQKNIIQNSCTDVSILQLNMESTAVAQGAILNVSVIIDSPCHYIGQVQVYVDNQVIKTINVNLVNEYNKTYDVGIDTKSLQSGIHVLSVHGKSVSFYVVSNTITPGMTAIAPVEQALPKAGNTSQQSVYVWGAVIGVFVVLGIIAFIL